VNPYEAIEYRAANAKSLEEAAEVVALLLSEGLAVWTDGRLYGIRQLVARVKGLRIEVYAREHPPPHFHIRGGDINATFSVTDCSLIDGQIGGRERALVEWWYKRSRSVLVRAWNESRPSDCPVGPIQE
jgi:hypothetical protein